MRSVQRSTLQLPDFSAKATGFDPLLLIFESATADWETFSILYFSIICMKPPTTIDSVSVFPLTVALKVFFKNNHII